MGRQAAVVLYVLALIAVVVGVDVLFFRNQFWVSVAMRKSPHVAKSKSSLVAS